MPPHPTEWREEFEQKFVKHAANPEERFMVLHTPDIPVLMDFIDIHIEAAERRTGEAWKTAVSYNCEPEEIERITGAVKALLGE